MDPPSLQVSSSPSNLTVNQSDGDRGRESGAAELKVSPQDGGQGRLILNYYLWS